MEMTKTIVIFVKETWYNDIETVKTFVERFEDLASANTDVLEKLAKFGNKTNALFKLAGPISTLLCEGFSGSFSPGSDDLKAIKLLHNSVKTEFLSLNQTVGNYFSYMYDYSDWLQRNIVRHCLNPNLLRSRNYVHALNTMDELENKIFVEEEFYKDNLFYKHWKKVTIDRLTHTSLSKSYRRINLLRNHFLEKNNTIDISNVTSVIHLIDTLDHAFIKVIGADFVNDPFKCLLQSFSVGAEKKRESLLNLAKIIMADMTKIAMLGVICSSVEDNKVVTDIKIQHLGETIEAIARKMHSWIVSELNSAWPVVIKKFAEEEMKKINESNYDFIAKLIQKSANDRGPSSLARRRVRYSPRICNKQNRKQRSILNYRICCESEAVQREKIQNHLSDIEQGVAKTNKIRKDIDESN
uniref:Uncharacterized protein n=1 Tax=Meloidogyne javanica TaxID=6303 RepID=A0A915LWV1_MELJA